MRVFSSHLVFRFESRNLVWILSGASALAFLRGVVFWLDGTESHPFFDMGTDAAVAGLDHAAFDGLRDGRRDWVGARVEA